MLAITGVSFTLLICDYHPYGTETLVQQLDTFAYGGSLAGVKVFLQDRFIFVILLLRAVEL